MPKLTSMMMKSIQTKNWNLSNLCPTLWGKLHNKRQKLHCHPTAGTIWMVYLVVRCYQCHVLYKVQNSVAVTKTTNMTGHTPSQENQKQNSVFALSMRCGGWGRERSYTCIPTHCRTMKQASWRRHWAPSRPLHRICLTWNETINPSKLSSEIH